MKKLNLMARFKRSKPEIRPLLLRRRKKKERRDCFKKLGLEGRIILKRILKKQDLKTWSEFIWLKAQTSGEPAWPRQ